MPLVDRFVWDQFLLQHSTAHILQTSAWGAVKSQAGWFPAYLVDGEAGAQILFRRLPGRFTVAYIPKGPLGTVSPAFWQEIVRVCRQHRAIFCTIEPDLWEGETADLLPWLEQNAHFAHSVQPRRTILLDLQGDPEALLARMKQKTRYNIHLAEKKEVRVRSWEDIPAFSRMMQVTSQRDGFGVHPEGYYRMVYDQFVPPGLGQLFVAEYQSTPLAAVLALKYGQRAWYFYGASTDRERNRMPAYLVQWQAIRWAQEQGCREYDLWGIPDVPEEVLEAEFTQRSEGLWGVYRFKRGFGGRVRRSSGAWDLVFQPAIYRLYLAFMRRRRSDYDA